MSETLAAEWTSWIAQNVLRGAPDDALVETLVGAGLSEERARDEVSAVRRSPITSGAAALLRRSAGVEQVARLMRERSPGVEEVDTLDEDELHRTFWLGQRPVVVRGAARHFPAMAWTFEALARRFGDVPVDVLAGRGAGWWTDREGHVARTTFGELVRTCLETVGDAVYADGRSELLATPGLEPLTTELGLLPGLVGDGFPRLWVGPAGTVTPLHHDQSSGWLVQLVGRKRMWMASPLEVALLTTTDGLFNTVDARSPPTGEVEEVRFATFELEPGDAVLIPVGWWHQVEALTPSISVSMGGFRWPSVHTWYCPGR
ncbi:MAG: cupin-like domain-containing protein [Myxococcales bacterium]|nr:cupin-like domain-containing protein [Myxococcales bacterium]